MGCWVGGLLGCWVVDMIVPATRSPVPPVGHLGNLGVPNHRTFRRVDLESSGRLGKSHGARINW